MELYHFRFMTFRAPQCSSILPAMNWNTKPPSYSKTQSSLLHQWLKSQVPESPSSLNSPRSTQDSCMYSSNSHAASQLLPNTQKYRNRQLLPANLKNRTTVPPQTSVDQRTYTNVSGPQPPNLNLQMSSGIMNSVWLNSPITNPLPYTEVAVAHQTDRGTNMPNVHTLQGHLVPIESYPAHLQMAPSSSVRNSVSAQGNERLNSSLLGSVSAQENERLNSSLLGSVSAQGNERLNSSLLGSVSAQGNERLNSSLLGSVSAQENERLNSSLLGSVSAQGNERLNSSLLGSVSVQGNERLNSSLLGSVSAQGNERLNSSLLGSVSAQGNERLNSSLLGSVSMQGNGRLNSLLGSILVQGNEKLNSSQQYLSPELMYPDNRPLPKQYSYSTPHSLAQEPGIQKPILMPSTSLQVQNSLLPTPTQTLQPVQTVAVATCQYAVEKRSPGPPPSYNCHYRIQPFPSGQPVKQLSPVDVPPKPDVGFYEIGKGFSQQWQNIDENRSMHEKLNTWPVNTNVKPFQNKPVESVVSLQTLAARNQEQMNSSIPTSEQMNSSILTSGPVLESTVVTKEKLVRDIKSLVEMKKKFSELARKIKINHNILKTAGCSKTANTMYTGPAQPSELSAQAVPAKSDSHCSMEVLATCLSLWQKSPAQVTEESISKLSMENQNVVPTTNKTTRVSEPLKEGPGKSLCSADGKSQSNISGPSSETVSSLVTTQSFESLTINTTKGTEPQVAVVSPLILSQDKALSVKVVALESNTEPLYPIIKEGSICSLQEELVQNTRVPPALHVDESGSGASAMSRRPSLVQKEMGYDPGNGNSEDPLNADRSKLPSLVPKEKQNEPGNGHSEDPPGAYLRKLLSLVQEEKENEPCIGNSEDSPKADPRKQSPVGDQETLCKSKDSTSVTSDTLQIGSICSLVEGDIAYDSQIANMFKSSPVKKIETHEPSLPNPQIFSGEQQKVHHACEKKEQFIHSADKPHEITSQSKPPQSQELSSKCGETDNVKGKNDCNTERVGPAQSMCHSSAIQPNPCPQEASADEDLTMHESTDNTSVLYLQDQLSELLREFPYGIEAMSTPKGSVIRQMTAQVSDDQNGREVTFDPKDSADQIQITILSSEQMKEIFPEEEDQSGDIGKLVEPKEKLVAQAENQHASPTPVGDEFEGDQVHCCALGWLSKLYEGVPHCQCKPTENSSEQNNEGKGQCSPLKTSTYKEGQRTPDDDVTIVECISISSKSKTPLTQMAQKNHLPKILDSGKKSTSQIKEKSPQRVEKELPHQASSRCDSDNKKHASKRGQGKSTKMRQGCSDQSSSKGDKLDPLQSHKKRKWKFHETTVSALSKTMTCKEPTLQKKQLKKAMSQASQPQSPQIAPTVEPPGRTNGSLVQSKASSKKLKFRAGGSKLIYLEKRKLDLGTTLDSEIKKRKMDHQQQPQKVENIPKLDNALSNQNERARVKGKSDSNAMSSSKSRVITIQEYLKRRKQKQMEDKASKKACEENVPSDPHSSRPSKCPEQEQGNKRPDKSHGGSLSSDPLNVSTSQDENVKVHHPRKDLKTHISRNATGKLPGKEPDKVCLVKNRLEKTSSNGGKALGPSQGKETKTYLNRLAFSTEGESICLAKLGSVPPKHHKDTQNQESKPKTFNETPNMLEFKLGPDVLLKNPTSAEELRDLQACPRNAQAPVQDNAKPKTCKRSCSTDGCETGENPAKSSSKAVFQTYKQMYLEKRSKSLGDSR
ncbi:retroelement silencing factor 1 isoform 2-T2 [Thomomys bottae]